MQSWWSAAALSLVVGSCAAASACGSDREAQPRSAERLDAAVADGGESHVDAGRKAPGTRDAASDEPTPPTSIDDLLEPLVAATCAYKARCGESEGYPRAVGGCAAVERPGLENQIEEAKTRLKDGRFRYDAASMAKCLDSMRAARCSALPKDDCVAAWGGTTPVGGECSSDAECGPDARCAGACPGHCVQSGKASHPCREARECARGYACEALVCQPVGSEGESCLADGGYYQCARGTRCSRTESGELRCLLNRKGAAGEDCRSLEVKECQAGSACVNDGAGHLVCKAVAELGGVCWGGWDDNCPAGEICPAPWPSTCTPRLGAGARCELNGTATCAVGLPCIDHDCLRPAVLGTTCERNEQCLSNRCREGQCARSFSCDEPLLPPVTCSLGLDAGAGEALVTFDSSEIAYTWGTQYLVYGEVPSGEASRRHDATEGHACPGALQAVVDFPGRYESLAVFSAPQEYLREVFHDVFRARRRLHAWVKLADTGMPPGSLDYIILYVETRDDHGGGYTTQAAVDAAYTLADHDWHEIIVDLSSTDLERVKTFGVFVQPAVAKLPGLAFQVSLYVDDFWLE